MPIARRVGNVLLSRLTSLALGVPVRDSQCGYTALSRAAAALLDLGALWPRYGYPNDMLARCVRAGVRVIDVPVRPIYGDEVSGLGALDALVVIPGVIARAALARRSGPARRAVLDPAE